MKQPITHCVLCGVALTPVRSFSRLLLRTLPDVLCATCYATFEPAASKEAIFTYNEAMQAWLNQYKILGDVLLAYSFAKELHAALAKGDIVVPIPLHPNKLAQRTFSQVALLLDCAEVPYVHYLQKVQDVTQGLRTRTERVASTNPFAVAPNADVSGKCFVVFDDIKTTGTTLKQARACLEEAGAKSVKTFTLCASEIK